MNYNFPKIEHIDQVRDAIQGRSEFREYNRGDYIVFNYVVATNDSFPEVRTAGGSAKMREQAAFKKALLRECRGLIFSPNGKVLARRFHKFFNYGERLETLDKNINWNQSFDVLDKVDGSMVSPLLLPNGIKWATKMGTTDIGEMAEKFVANKPQYNKLAKDLADIDCTPIFEYVGPYNRVVIEYPNENVILLAIRNNTTGKYMSTYDMIRTTLEYGIPVVEPRAMTQEQLFKEASGEIGVEGYVLRFTDGHMIKLKSDWYCAIHKAKENLLFEKNVIKMILEEKIDDILPNLPDSDVQRLLEFKEQILTNVSLTEVICETWLARHQHLSKKDFALIVAPKLDPFTRSVCFACWDGEQDMRQTIIDNIIKKTGTQTNVESIRHIIGDPWKPA